MKSEGVCVRRVCLSVEWQRKCGENAELCYSRIRREHHEVGSLSKVYKPATLFRCLRFPAIWPFNWNSFTNKILALDSEKVLSHMYYWPIMVSIAKAPKQMTKYCKLSLMDWSEERTPTIHVQTRTPKVTAKKKKKKQSRMLPLLWYQHDQSQKVFQRKLTGSHIFVQFSGRACDFHLQCNTFRVVFVS